MFIIPNGVCPKTTNTCIWKPRMMTDTDEFVVMDKVISKTLTNMSKCMDSVMVSGVSPNLFRIVCDEIGFVPNTIEINIQGNQMEVCGLVQVRVDSGMFLTKEFKKLYQLPHYVMVNKYNTLFTEHGQLIVEFPIITTTETIPTIGTSRFTGLNNQMLNETFVHPESGNITCGNEMFVKKTPIGITKYSMHKNVMPYETEEMIPSQINCGTTKKIVVPDMFVMKPMPDERNVSVSTSYLMGYKTV